MTGSTHVAIAVAATLGLAAATKGQVSPPTALAWVVVVIGSLAPDIDGGGTIARPGSLLQRLLPRWLARLLDKIGLTISGLIRSILGHRNATHWPAWALIMMSAVPLLPTSYSLLLTPYSLLLFWFGFGCLMHIAGDFLTTSGVPLLGPFSTKDFSGSPLRTGTWPEYVLVAPACWGFIFWQGWHSVPAEARFWVARFAGSLLTFIN